MTKKLVLFVILIHLLPWCLLLRSYLGKRRARLQEPEIPPPEAPPEPEPEPEPEPPQGVPTGELMSLRDMEPIRGFRAGELWNIGSYVYSSTPSPSYTGRRARLTREVRLRSASGNLELIDAGVEFRERSDGLWETTSVVCRFNVIQRAVRQGAATLVQSMSEPAGDLTILPMQGFDPQAVQEAMERSMSQAMAQFEETARRMTEAAAGLTSERRMARQANLRYFSSTPVSVSSAPLVPVGVKVTVKTEPEPPKPPDPKSAIDRLLENDSVLDDGEK